MEKVNFLRMKPRERDEVQPHNRKRMIGLLLAFFVCAICFSTPFRNYASIPDEMRLFKGQNKQIELAVPVNGQVTVDNPDIVKVNGSAAHSFQMNFKHPISLESLHSGQAEMKLKLFGAIPVKTVKVNVVPDLKVIPGGQTIGVKIKSAGILVVGHHLVTAADNKKVSPGEDAKVQVGDLIIKFNGTYLNDVSKVADLVTKAGESNKPLKLTISRDNQLLDVELTPAFDTVDKSYRLGLYIRDTAAGVGTLTFYAPDQKKCMARSATS